jgi:amino acid adenylation domain-containing protein
LVGWLDDAPPPPEQVMPAFRLADLAACPATPPATANGEEDIAHILFTSGSTGVPKGVMIQHRSVKRFIQWAKSYFGTSAGERISQHPPLHFDLSTFDIYATLSAGAELHLVPHELNLLPNKLSQFIFDNRLTQWFSVPSALNLMAKFDVVVQDDFPELRRIMWCGEAMPTPTLIYWMRRLPHVQFTNLYGPTEATIASSYYTVPACPASPQEAIPIGRACDGEELLVLDADLRLVPRGELGEIYIRGAGLSPGYWRDPQKTGAAFRPYIGVGGGNLAADGRIDRVYRTGDLGRQGADGLFYFAGRADTQIKSRGYRIELGEIEAALATLPGLRESAVVAVPSEGFEGWKICCAYAPAEPRDPGAEHLRKQLSGLLPAYMLPALWERYEALPKNVNGKIDRPALKAAFERRAAQAPARTSATTAVRISQPGDSNLPLESRGLK